MEAWAQSQKWSKNEPVEPFHYQKKTSNLFQNYLLIPYDEGSFSRDEV